MKPVGKFLGQLLELIVVLAVIPLALAFKLLVVLLFVTFLCSPFIALVLIVWLIAR